MENDQEELRKLRGLLDELERKIDALEVGQAFGTGAFAAQTATISSYPVAGAALKTFGGTVLDVFGPDTEGGTATTGAGSGNVYIVNLASGLPASGDKVLVDRVPYANVFIYR